MFADGRGLQWRLEADPAMRDATSDALLDRLLRCASHGLAHPIALVRLTDKAGRTCRASLGLDATESAAGGSFETALDAHTPLLHDWFEVVDASTDPRFSRQRLVAGGRPIRACVSLPICSRGERVGTLCVADHAPRRPSVSQDAMLADLADTLASWHENWLDRLALQAERAQSAQRLELLERLTEQTPGMLFQCRVDPDGAARMPYASSQTQALFAVAPEDIRSDLAPLLDRIDSGDRDTLVSALMVSAVSLATPALAPIRVEFRVSLPGQERLWHVMRASPSRQADGGLLWHGFIADITEQTEIETLRREKLAAERASAEKTAFLSRVSHELRTPLNAMLGFTQLLLLEAVDPLTANQRGWATHAHKASQRLLGLIEDVLHVSRIEQGAKALVRAPIELHALALECLPLVAQMAEQTSVRIELHQPPAGPPVTVSADRRALEQAVLNLLTNGIKYNRRGGLLRIELKSEGEHASLCITDQGPGLDDSQRSRLFRPFDRLGAENSKIEGSGLGLVISRQLVESMGGRIDVDSEPGRGSTFSIILPVHGDAGLPVVSPEVIALKVPNRHDDDVTVLYIEDDPVNALLVQEALQCRPGWRIFHAADGLTGLALAQTLQPTVVLTDINLPGLSGQGIVRSLRGDSLVRNTICIALSADAMNDQIADAMGSGFDDYWTKPLDVRVLAERIEAWLDRGESRLSPL